MEYWSNGVVECWVRYPLLQYSITPAAISFGGFMKSLWKRYRPLRVISPIVFLLSWEGVVRLGEVNQLLVPAPASVLRTMVELTVDGRLPWAIAVSLHRVLQGFIYGSLLGIGLGLLVGW